MTEVAVKTVADFTLPSSVMSKVDLSRLVNEFEKLDNDLTEVAVRAKAGAGEQSKPIISEVLREFLLQNKVQVDDGRVRGDLAKQLRLLKDNVPVINMTFATEADPDSLQQLTQWLRTTVHPQAVIAVGLQPALIAGVYLRTPNHVLDLSLRAQLKNGHGLLVKELEVLGG